MVPETAGTIYHTIGDFFAPVDRDTLSFLLEEKMSTTLCCCLSRYEVSQGCLPISLSLRSVTNAFAAVSLDSQSRRDACCCLFIIMESLSVVSAYVNPPRLFFLSRSMCNLTSTFSVVALRARSHPNVCCSLHLQCTQCHQDFCCALCLQYHRIIH